MADAVTTAASAAAAGALTGAPPDMVIFGAILGAAVSLWSRDDAPAELTWKWARIATVHSSGSILLGVVGSTMLMNIAPAIPAVSALARSPQWTWAVAFSWAAHWLIPRIPRLADRLMGRTKESSDGQ